MFLINWLQRIAALLSGIHAALREPYDTGLVRVLGIGTGVAYAAGDAFGPKFYLEVPTSGVIQTLRFVDLDDEGIEKDILFFNADFADTADNAAFDPADGDLAGSAVGFITVTAADYRSFADSNLAVVNNCGLGYVAPEGKLWIKIVTRGADNIAAGSQPRIGMVIL